MAKKNAAAATTTEGGVATEAKNGHKVILPNGVERITFIRDSFYNGDETLKGNRSAIKNAINKMYEDAAQPDGQIPYQIVFAATKEKTDPRIASAEAKAAKAAAKVAEAAQAAAATPAPEAVTK